MYNRNITAKQDTLEDGSSNLTLYFFSCQHPIIFSFPLSATLSVQSLLSPHTSSALSSCYITYAAAKAGYPVAAQTL